jgi:hypothetical protein
MAQVVECLPSKSMSSNPSTARRKKSKRAKGEKKVHCQVYLNINLNSQIISLAWLTLTCFVEDLNKIHEDLYGSVMAKMLVQSNFIMQESRMKFFLQSFMCSIQIKKSLVCVTFIDHSI